MEALMTEIMTEATASQSADIHIQPKNNKYDVLLRDLGQLRKIRELSQEEGSQLIRYLKYMGHMDVGERRQPQDGRVFFQLADREYELRLSTMANYQLLESMVVRLLYQEDKELNQVGLDTIFSHLAKAYLQKKSGLIIFSGPVASGKTTTIYYLLRQVFQKTKRQIICIEDPVEIREANFLQTEINDKAGIGFDQLIKAALRHHPDILVIGEVRDVHTARMMMRAALTGHLVVATIHAKNCFGVIERLKELEVTDLQLHQTLLLVSSQRLIPGIREVAWPVFEWLAGADLQTYLSDKQVTDNFRTLNQNIEQAVTDGKISRAAAQPYRLEETAKL
ncbi:hypothetical protein AWM75_02175 [Aerococcus urinaehominis]|uniref:Bacterial type II secretion system protein E domain-containing protein n=2 Tax=Aerococcus urinaehominis TaxID=128944 RepID=A0A120IB40_9LACT|nr:hypothetical protein AWM75_02175 [Aerococcus urinaehominis]